MLPEIRNRPTLRRRGTDLTDWTRIFDSAFGDLNGWTAWAPAANLYETNEEFVLEMGLPGFDSSNIDVNVERGILTVSGQRARSEEEERQTYHLRELTHERFSRSFSFPSSVDSDDVRADFHNGVLTVTLPKSAEAKPRRIEVSAK